MYFIALALMALALIGRVIGIEIAELQLTMLWAISMFLAAIYLKKEEGW